MSFIRIQLNSQNATLNIGRVVISSGLKYTSFEIRAAEDPKPQPIEDEPTTPFWELPAEEQPDVRTQRRARALRAAESAARKIRARQGIEAPKPPTVVDTLFGIALKSRRVAAFIRGCASFLLNHNVGLQGVAA